jgi:hypothetical protein
MKKGQKHKTLRTHFTEHRNIDGFQINFKSLQEKKSVRKSDLARSLEMSGVSLDKFMRRNILDSS